MRPLEKSLRNKLEKTIKEARDIAEDAARAALEQLSVGEPKAYPHLSDDNRKLRRRLRSHGRQLGNGRNSKGEQALDRLIEEVAYEHWHRMLFARFLAENNLLMYPDPDDPVAVTLEECEDLAPDEGAANGWELVARFAACMLPQIFGHDSPAFQLILPPEYEQKLEHLVTDLPLEVFTAPDSLGWVYQFWQIKKKDEVNASEVKIGARELPAVTQLFTEPYMVNFLLDNSLGAWWAAHYFSDDDFNSASNEEELRSKASLPGVPLDHLRFIQDINGKWAPAAGNFNDWPENLKDLKVIDPCCGSGHFLLAAFLMLVQMRMKLEGLSESEAADSVLSENIYGLELDQRCVEIVVFSLALNSWKISKTSGYRHLPKLNIACTGLAISVMKEEWVGIAERNPNLRLALGELYEQFKEAPLIGSLINPGKSLSKDSIMRLSWEQTELPLSKLLSEHNNEDVSEMGVVALGLSKALSILSNSYHLVCTNVPYLGAGDQIPELREYIETNYYPGRKDLATAFLLRALEFCNSSGLVALVIPQHLFSLNPYKQLRSQLWKDTNFSFISRLGPGAFEMISGEVVNVALVHIENKRPINDDGFYAIDVVSKYTPEAKEKGLKEILPFLLSQKQQLKNPDQRLLIKSDNPSLNLLSNYANCYKGLATGDLPRFIRTLHEIGSSNNIWSYMQTSPDGKTKFSSRGSLVRWENGNGELFKFVADKLGISGVGAWIRGKPAWGKKGIAIAQMRGAAPAMHSGNFFDENTGVILPKKKGYLPAIYSFCCSDKYYESIRKIDTSLKIPTLTLLKVQFEFEYWTKVAEEKYPNGMPKAYSDDPTQWIFHGHPCGSVVWNEDCKWTAQGLLRSDETVLQVAVARLLGYRWPAEFDGNMELADEQREWVNRCEVLLPYADTDGIVCIPPVRGESSAAERLLNLLVAAYGDSWSNDVQAQLLKNVGHAGKTLETWLRDKLFTQHCKLFHHRPFIWQIWDGLRDGFAALVNYHKLDSKLLETLIYTYLGNWINRQKQDITSGVDGAQEKLAAAESLQKKLELILEGETPYDIFVRWKSIEKQPIGWNPNLNDGVRINIRPFMTVGDVKKKGAGVLRDKPNIKWGKDRGKDVESAPWYHLFNGDRINDHHLSLAEKRAAREAERNG